MYKIKINQTLLFLLIFTIIASSIAYGLVVKAYEDVFEIGFNSF